MKKFCRFSLSLIAAVVSAQPAIAQPAQSSAKAPARLAGAAPYGFPGQWILLGDAVGQQDNIIAYYYDAARTQRAGNIVATVWIGIDEKNIDGIRTNLYETEVDCSTNRARFARVQNYDFAHYPLATPPEQNGEWQTLNSGSPVAAVAATLCSRGPQPSAKVSGVQGDALRVFRTRREISAFAAQWGPYAFLAQQGWWRRADGAYWRYSWITPGQELGAEWYSAEGQRAWNLRLHIKNGALTSDQLPPQPIRFLSSTIIEHGQNDRIALTDNGRRMSYRSGDQQDIYEAAPPPSFAQGENPRPINGSSDHANSGWQPVSIADAQRRFGAAVDGASYPVGAGNAPGQWQPLQTSTECVSRFRLALPDRTINGRAWPASSSDYDVTWSRILSAESSPGAAYLRLPTQAYAQFGIQVNEGQQAVAVAAARYLIIHCKSGAPSSSKPVESSQAQPPATSTPRTSQQAENPGGQQIWIERSMVELDRTYIPTFWYQTSLTGHKGDRYRISWSGTRLDIDYEIDRMTGTYPPGQSIDDYAGSVVLTFKTDGVLPVGLGQPSDTATFTRYRVTITKIN